MNSRGHSPLDALGDDVGSGAVEAFKLLGDETRLAILLALWDAYDPHAGDDAVAFSELRDRVGTRDSGQFNYHLGKLTGRFVEATDDGYRLRPVGLKLVQTVIADAGEAATLPPTEIDVPCSICGAPTAITHRDGWLYHLCTECEGGFGRAEDYPEGALFAIPFPSSALANRTPEEVFAAGTSRLLVEVAMKMGGLCPRCSGLVETTTHVCPDHDPDLEPGEVCPACGNAGRVRVRWVCTVCKYRGSSSPATVVGVHPAVTAFYHDHGVATGYTGTDFEGSTRLLELIRSHEAELVSTDPFRTLITVRYDDDELELTLDEELTVVEASERGG